MLATRTRYTCADTLQQAPDDYNVYDILEGELVVWLSPNGAHWGIVIRLLRCLIAAEDAQFGHVRTARSKDR